MFNHQKRISTLVLVIIDDNQPDDFVEWREYFDAYAVSVE